MKNNKGITLIALVITIIVLLILAGITIAMLTGENGILNNATKSKAYDQLGAAKDKVALTVSEEITNYFNSVYVNSTTAQYNKATVKSDVCDKVAAMRTGIELPTGVSFVGSPNVSTAGVFVLRYGDYTVQGTIGDSGSLTWGDITYSPANS